MSSGIVKKIIDLADRPWFQPALLFAASLGLYLATLPKAVSFEDSAEFVTAAYTLGIPHPSGYPLYVLLAWPFAHLPFGTIPWRVALFSAVCASAALVVGLLLARRLIRFVAPLAGPSPSETDQPLAGTSLRAGRLASWVALLLLLQLAVSEVWWSQAVYAKIYPLHVLLVAVAMLALVSWFERPEADRPLYLTAFLLGLAASNHLFLTLAVLPFFLLAAVVRWPKLLIPSRRWLFAILSLFVGLLPYAYLPIRSAAHPAYAIGQINSWSAFWIYVSRRAYGDVGLQSWNKVGLIFSLFAGLAASLGLIVTLAGLVGTGRLAVRPSRARFAALILVGGGILAAPLALIFRTMDFTDTSAYLVRVYGLTAHLSLAVLAAVGAAVVLPWLLPPARRVWPTCFVLIIGLSLVGLTGWRNWSGLAAYRDSFVENYGRALISNLPPRAVLIVNDYTLVHDTEMFTLAYLRAVQGQRPDITIFSGSSTISRQPSRLPADYDQLDLAGQRRELFMAALIEPDFADRPLFFTYPPEGISPGYHSRSNGLLYELERGLPISPVPSAELELPSSEIWRDQPALKSILARILYAEAARQFDVAGSRAAVGPLIQAIQLDPVPSSDDYRGFQAYRQARLKL